MSANISLECPKCKHVIAPHEEVTFEATATVRGSAMTTLDNFYEVGVAWDAYESWDEHVICPECGTKVPLVKPDGGHCHI